MKPAALLLSIVLATIIAVTLGHPVVDTPELRVKIIPTNVLSSYDSPRYMKVEIDPDSPTIRITKQPTNLFGNIRGARLHVAPGAYPVYYALARTNGKFNGKYIRALTPAEISAYANSL